MDSWKQKLADVLAIGSVGTWIAAHIAQINEFLQALAFLIAIVSGAVAIRYHWAKTQAIKNGRT